MKLWKTWPDESGLYYAKIAGHDDAATVVEVELRESVERDGVEYEGGCSISFIGGDITADSAYGDRFEEEFYALYGPIEVPEFPRE